MANAGRLPADNTTQTAGGLGRRGIEQRREPLAGRGSGAGAVIVAVERNDNKRRRIQTGTVALASEAERMWEVGTGDEQQCYQAMTVELREKVQQIIESKVNKLQQVTQQNVQSVVKHGTLSTLLRGTQWKASDAVWNWIARRQEEGDSRVCKNMQRKVAAAGSGTILNWQAAAQVKAGESGQDVGMHRLKDSEVVDRLF